jgi:ATP-dependent Clp protease protease subunit
MGGVIASGLAIYDTMQLIRPDVSTICVGMAASMGTLLLCAGTRGKRYALPNSTIHMHQAVGGAQGQAADIEIAAREIMRLQDIIRNILVAHTGQPMKKIVHDTDRDFYLDPQQAVKYRIVDEILNKPTEKKAKTGK